jgi:4-amino-4-deoxy-L-arabinose transferase-like glycosyltransferase
MMMKLSRVNGIRIFIFLGAMVLFLSFNGQLHLFDWDEINFAESAREMITTGDYATVMINFEPFWEKPPLFIWMQVISMKLFGINEFAARFPNAICGMLTLLFLFEVGRRHFGFKFGWIWALVYASSFLPFFYFKSGIIDPWFNLFIYGSIYTLIRYTDNQFNGNRTILTLIGGILLGLAILTKGPAGVLIAVLTLTIFLVVNRFRTIIYLKHVVIFSLATILTGGSWFLHQLLTGNGKIIVDFIEYQIRLFSTEGAGHGGFFLYHFVVVLIGVFPASLFAIPSLKVKKNILPVQKHDVIWNIVIMMTVLLLFTIVKTKIVHYSSLAYFPVSFLAAIHIHNLIDSRKSASKIMTVGLGIIVFVYLSILIFLSNLDVIKTYLLDNDLIKDSFAKANLEAKGGWSRLEWLSGITLAFGYLGFLWFRKRSQTQKAILSLLGGSMLYIYLSMILIIPKIESYSQASLIKFCKSTDPEKSYVETIGFKSYAPLFYGRRIPPSFPDISDLSNPIAIPEDRELFIVMKITRKLQYLEKYPQLEYLYEKNGYVFTKYNPDKPLANEK